ncbi:DNA methyltransferase [Thermosulfurimonas sp. F29]|uniref:DNA methyltransferase n=1 Tax=Thermosulfurimonas sp. F29 TaxID=2867247 RepID=UPI001C83E58F|nr:DNA methyltransferase [Thermosulfurimonas sp. F29]MBX6422300.1 helix-turn-helix domain-containing protein [Thermosulfurimonas sp. F29]
MDDYKKRKYLSAIEVAKYLGITVRQVHHLVKIGKLRAFRAASGQYRFDLNDVKQIEGKIKLSRNVYNKNGISEQNIISVNDTVQIVYVKDAREMKEIGDNSVHLMITSPPYFNAKLYSKNPLDGDLGNIHDLDEWFNEISKVWREVYRVLQPGRKAFINIMNLPIRTEDGFRSLNIVGRTIDICENIGFIFRREIIWHKTNSVKAHFGTFPYPGNILINYAHEFILEFEKPAPKGYKKYSHLTTEQKEASKLDKEFWIDIKKSDVWLMKPEKSGDNRNHPAPFPYELPYRLIKAYSYVGETVLDPFLGSGTTLVAARDLKRNGIGYEINKEIAEEAVTRIKNFQQRLL